MPKPKVCIDAFNLALAKGSGIATYARNLGVALAELGFETHLLHGPSRSPGRTDLLNEVALFDAAPPRRSNWRTAVWRRLTPPVRRAVQVKRTGAVETRQMQSRDFGADVLWSSGDIFHTANRRYLSDFRFTKVLFDDLGQKKRPDLMHWTCVLPIISPKSANVYTIHDLVPFKLPFATLDNKRSYYKMCRKICNSADHIITVSEKSREDIISVFGVGESRITNTFQSVSIPEKFVYKKEVEVVAEVEGVFDLPWKGYFLFFGAVEPKKNLSRTIEAYLASGVSAPLVIVGGRAWLDEDETRLMYDDLVQLQHIKDGVIRRADRIRRYDYLPFETLVGLIRGAKATLFPSLYEGFGLPILESMLLGTPVLTSTTGACPEIAGDAALLVDPYETRAIKRGIQALDQDAALREDLSRRGRIQAAKFSPKAYEQRLSDLYRKLL